MPIPDQSNNVTLWTDDTYVGVGDSFDSWRKKTNGLRTLMDGSVTNAKVAADAAIVDTKLATIATAGKVSNSATTATTNNNASTLVLRDGSGYITVADPTTSTHVANKTYVDTALSSAISIISSGGVPGYLKLNNSIIIQWGYLTPTQRETAITLAIPFPNAFLSGTATIGENFTDTRYDDNGFSWGLYPTVGFLKTKVTLMSNLRVDNNSVTFLKMYWIAIGY